MKINITAGECLNKILTSKYINETFIPFNEAMIKGSYNAVLFSKEFINHRCLNHKVTINEFEVMLNVFLTLLKDVNKYQEIVLWFGDDDFCVENSKTVILTLKEYGYTNKLSLNVVIEETGEIKQTKIID